MTETIGLSFWTYQKLKNSTWIHSPLLDELKTKFAVARHRLRQEVVVHQADQTQSLRDKSTDPDHLS
jgi:hypothetical protein